MTDQLSLLFFRSSGIAAEIEREACRFSFQRFEDVPAHVAIVIGDQAFEAISTGVHSMPAADSRMRPDVIREIVIPERTPEQLAGALLYAKNCLEDPYSWDDIRLTCWAFALPGIVSRFPQRDQHSHGATICSLYALLTLAHAGLQLPTFFSPATTPNELMVRVEDACAALTLAPPVCECANVPDNVP